ncbi:MAG: hypothetical protein AAF641_08645 [Pseudomonadota bacterium]
MITLPGQCPAATPLKIFEVCRHYVAKDAPKFQVGNPALINSVVRGNFVVLIASVYSGFDYGDFRN